MVQLLVENLSLLKFYLGEHNCIIIFIYADDKNMTAKKTIRITGLNIYTSIKLLENSNKSFCD